MSNVSGGPLPLRDGVNNEENPRTPNSCKNKKKKNKIYRKSLGMKDLVPASFWASVPIVGTG